MGSKRKTVKFKPRFGITFSYVLSDIRSKWFLFSMNVFAIAIAAIYILVVTYFATGSHRVQKEMMEKNTKANMILARTPITRGVDEKFRFTPDTIKDLKEKCGGISEIIPLIGNNFGLNVTNGNSLGAEIEGSTPNDPDLLEARWIQGGMISSDDAEEIVLTQPLYNSLTMDSAGKRLVEPEMVELFFERTVNRVKSSYRRNYRLVGMIDSPAIKGYIPLKRIKWLEIWGSNKIDEVPGTGSAAPMAEVSVEALRVYISSQIQPEEIKEITEHFKVKLKKIPEWNYDEFSCAIKPQLRLAYPNGETFDASLPRKLMASKAVAGAEVLPIIVTPVALKERPERETIFLAMPLDDPRLENMVLNSGDSLKTILSAPGQIVLSEQFAKTFPIIPDVLNTTEEFLPSMLLVHDGWVSGNFGKFQFDAICSPETMAYLRHKIELEFACLLITQRRQTVSNLNAGIPFGRVYPIEETDDWLNPPIQPEPEYNPDAYQYYPRGLDEESIGSEKINPITESGQNKTLSIKHVARGNNYSVSRPYYAVCLIPEDNKTVLTKVRQLKDSTLKIVPLWLIPDSTIEDNPELKLAIADSKDMAKLPFIWAKTYPTLRGSAIVNPWSFDWETRISAAGREFDLLLVSDEPYPKKLVLVAVQDLNKYDLILKSADWKNSHRSYLLNLVNCVDVVIPDVTQYIQFKEEAIKEGFAVTDLCEIKQTPIFGYELRSSEAGGKISQKLLEFLKVERTFSDVNPLVVVQASKSGDGKPGAKYSFCASHASDPTARRLKLKAGRWLDDENLTVVLPEALVIGAGEDPANVVDKRIGLIFENEKAKTASEATYKIEFTVCGVVAGEEGYISSDAAVEVSLWQAGRMKYTERKGFTSGVGNYEESGYDRCKIFARQLEDVRPIVTYLKQKGYETEDALENQEIIRRQARLMAFLSGMVIIGSVLNGIISVSIATLMNTKSKTFEIAVLRAYGATKKLLFRLFNLQGILMGLIAFLLAFPSAVGIVELIKAILVNGSFSISEVELEEMTRVPIWSPEFLWLHLLAFGTSLLFCLLGVWVSAIYASRISITNALMRE